MLFHVNRRLVSQCIITVRPTVCCAELQFTASYFKADATGSSLSLGSIKNALHFYDHFPGESGFAPYLIQLPHLFWRKTCWDNWRRFLRAACHFFQPYDNVEAHTRSLSSNLALKDCVPLVSVFVCWRRVTSTALRRWRLRHLKHSCEVNIIYNIVQKSQK